jgi:hypothetical protein
MFSRWNRLAMKMDMAVLWTLSLVNGLPGRRRYAKLFFFFLVISSIVSSNLMMMYFLDLICWFVLFWRVKSLMEQRSTRCSQHRDSWCILTISCAYVRNFVCKTFCIHSTFKCICRLCNVAKITYTNSHHSTPSKISLLTTDIIHEVLLMKMVQVVLLRF